MARPGGPIIDPPTVLCWSTTHLYASLRDNLASVLPNAARHNLACQRYFVFVFRQRVGPGDRGFAAVRPREPARELALRHPARCAPSARTIIHLNHPRCADYSVRPGFTIHHLLIDAAPAFASGNSTEAGPRRRPGHSPSWRSVLARQRNQPRPAPFAPGPMRWNFASNAINDGKYTDDSEVRRH